jgi:hypothetical protein
MRRGGWWKEDPSMDIDDEVSRFFVERTGYSSFVFVSGLSRIFEESPYNRPSAHHRLIIVLNPEPIHQKMTTTASLP